MCTLPKKEGQCYKSINRWYYDADNMVCKKIKYNGCDGNKNRFVNKKKCIEKCDGVSKYLLKITNSC